ncbi:S-4TM family putative pore-forming effector [Streptomyces sp. NPDC087420]|uniref:S-4TM family putative pore-forming effector n=1 Tax=Streptomyces sp. NPDC087420 TaxID=3365785 RepID=UPI003833D605
MSRPVTAGTDIPRGVPGRPIHERQLDDDMLRLQRAAAANHRQGQRVEAVRTAVATALSVAGVVVMLTGRGSTAVSIAGFLWFLVSSVILGRIASATALRSALLQEMFDTTLFHLPWRTTVAGAPVPDAEVHRLAHRLRPGGPVDRRITEGWYHPTGGVHHPYDVFIAQEQNLAWDARMRRRYHRLVLSAALGWSLLGLLAGLVTGAPLSGVLLGFFVPSLAAYQIAHDIWSTQQRVTAERGRLAEIVTAELRTARARRIPGQEWHRVREVARDVQDGVLRTRLETARVPEWFYRRFRDSDERDFTASGEAHRRRLAEGEG